MTVIDILLIINLLVLCIVSSVLDIKKQIVPNVLVGSSIATGLILQLVSYGFIVHENLFYHIVSVAGGIILSVLMYALNIWAAGDSKLLIGIIISLPAKYLQLDSYLSFQSVSIVFYSFAIAFLFLIMESLLKRVRDKNIQIQNLKTDLWKFVKSYIACSLHLFGINSFLLLTFPNSFEYLKDYSLLLNLILVMIISKNRFFYNTKVILVSTLIDILEATIMIRFSIFVNLSVSSFLIALLIFLLKLLSEEYNYETIPLSDLKPGMIPSMESALLISNLGVLPDEFDKMTEDLKSRLTADEVSIIIKSAHQKFNPKIVIVKKTPFAAFISIGTIVFFIFGAL